MIVRMSKLEIAGPRELLLEVLDVIRELGIFQPESEANCSVLRERHTAFHSFALDERIAAQRLLLEKIRRMTAEIIALLPAVKTRESWLDPLSMLDMVAAAAEKHLGWCREVTARREALRREREELEHYAVLLATIASLVGDVVGPSGGLEFIGVTLRDPSVVDGLRGLLARISDGEFSLTTTVAADGALIGLIAVPASRGERIKNALSEAHFPEFPVPVQFREVTLPERIRGVHERLESAQGAMMDIDRDLERFARQWLPLYRRIDLWLLERLALLRATTAVHETGMCFVIHGWVRADDTEGLTRLLGERFGNKVALEEQRIVEQDLERVPVALRNPPYLRPFELFTRMLPLPSYASWDPTPFIGIFFPLFFGMMLGDAGHGLVLVIAALLVLVRHRQGTIGDAARILLISASYAVVFGILFGEVFGEAGARLLHMEPLVLERSRAIMPMLIFSVALGISHVILGLILGLITALRRHRRREVAARMATIGLIICLALLVGSLIIPSPWLLAKPIIITAAILVPLLILSGGFLAPLELIKYVGNIISYTRIMAIGLGSALLANAANQLAGLSGDLIIGTLTAIVLHAVAIVLGVFAPTIHGLRLHFVEFLSKFVEHGVRRFEPFNKQE